MQQRRSGKSLKPAPRSRRDDLALTAAQARRRCDPDRLGFETTTELEPLHLGLSVQRRALDAIELGLGLKNRGYNLFVLGEPDSGKTSMVKLLLKKRASREPTPPDLCYVYDFSAPDRPRPVHVPAGEGPTLAEAIDDSIHQLQRSIPRTLTSDAFGLQRQGVVTDYRDQMELIRDRLERDAAELRFKLRPDGDSFVPVPLLDGKPMGEDDFAALPAEERSAFESAAMALRDRMAEHDLRLQRLERELDQAVAELERQAIRPVVRATLRECLKSVAHLNDEEIPAHFERLGVHVVDNHWRFLPRPEDESEEAMAGDSPPEDPFVEYRVNVVVHRKPDEGAPVVFERQPTLGRILGCLEYRDSRGVLRADHTSIRAGALHQAAGGYLIVQASDLAKRPTAWEALKRALRDRDVRIEEPEDEGRPRTAGTVRPMPTPLSAKVVVLGTPDAYYGLLIGDEEFARLFKVKAEFEPTIPWNARNLTRIARFLALVVSEEGNLPLDRTAVAKVIEYASRESGDQRRLSTRVASLLDLVAEADYRARRRGNTTILAADVTEALHERRRRHSCDEDEFLRTIREGALIVSTAGEVVGQVNGVAVYNTGDHAFGVPARITARTWVGRAGVINIDREVQLSGQIHDKGTLIMIGLLGDRCAQERPLALSASITFEQSYDLVEGDSASCAEFLALLSSLSGIPARQGVAITGSVDQQGVIQPVGGVNEKIEGMYRACQLKGLTGEQGVVIPTRNIRNLMLDEDVADAVGSGKFHIWSVAHVDEAIELVLGRPAGRRRADGTWEEGSINALVEHRLSEMAKSLARHKVEEPTL
jgi:lon-related putative ATP-dependent protease